MSPDTTRMETHRQQPDSGEQPVPPSAADKRPDWRERARERRQRLVQFGDVFHVATFVVAEFVARVVPERHWRGVSLAFARASLAARRFRVRGAIARLDANLGGRIPDELNRRTLLASIVGAFFEERVFFHKAAHDPAWRPNVRLDGGELLDAALAAGRGAVIWVAPMIFSTLLVKIALHDAGHRVAHLSVPWHGPARTRFGRWLVNARAVVVEERFVERIIIPMDGRAGAVLDELGQRVRSNRIVTITAVDNANKPLEAPFLRGSLRLGPGAPRLALSHRAPLFAAILARDAAGAFCVKLHPLTSMDTGTAVDTMNGFARAFADAYARGVIESPALWKIDPRPRTRRPTDSAVAGGHRQ